MGTTCETGSNAGKHGDCWTFPSRWIEAVKIDARNYCLQIHESYLDFSGKSNIDADSWNDYQICLPLHVLMISRYWFFMLNWCIFFHIVEQQQLSLCHQCKCHFPGYIEVQIAYRWKIIRRIQTVLRKNRVILDIDYPYINN